jgi:hypothetical protein
MTSVRYPLDAALTVAISGGLKWNEYGVYAPSPDGPKRRWWKDGAAFTTPERVTIDPVAFSEYADLARRARSQGVIVIQMSPPTQYDRWRLAKAGFDRSYSQMATLFRTDDPSIDFNHPGRRQGALAPLRANLLRGRIQPTNEFR